MNQNIFYSSQKQQVEVQTYVCFGYEVTEQLQTGTVVLNSFVKTDDGLHVKDEIYVLGDGSTEEYE